MPPTDDVSVVVIVLGPVLLGAIFAAVLLWARSRSKGTGGDSPGS